MVPMRWSLWLAQPETERSLRMVLQIIAVAAALWTVAAAYGVWNTRAALAAAQVSVSSQSDQVLQITRDLPGKRRQSLKAAQVKVISSQGAGSADITEELAGLAREAGAEVQGVRIGGDGQAAVPPQAVPPPAGAGTPGANGEGLPNAAPGTTAKAAGSGDGSSETFECNIIGKYPSLTRFLSGLAASRHVLDITSLQVTQGDGKSPSHAPRLEMKISGTVYETPEKS